MWLPSRLTYMYIAVMIIAIPIWFLGTAVHVYGDEAREKTLLVLTFFDVADCGTTSLVHVHLRTRVAITTESYIAT